MLSELDKRDIWRHDSDSIMENPFALSNYTYKGENIDRVTYHASGGRSTFIVRTLSNKVDEGPHYHNVSGIMAMIPDMDVKGARWVEPQTVWNNSNQEQPEEDEIGSAVEDLINTIMQN